MQGELEESAAHVADGLALAERHGELVSLAWAHYGAGVSHQFFERGRTAEAREVLASAHAWFANRRAAANEIVAARQLLTELRD